MASWEAPNFDFDYAYSNSSTAHSRQQPQDGHAFQPTSHPSIASFQPQPPPPQQQPQAQQRPQQSQQHKRQLSRSSSRVQAAAHGATDKFLFVDAGTNSKSERTNARSFVMQRARAKHPWSTSKKNRNTPSPTVPTGSGSTTSHRSTPESSPDPSSAPVSSRNVPIPRSPRSRTQALAVAKSRRRPSPNTTVSASPVAAAAERLPLTSSSAPASTQLSASIPYCQNCHAAQLQGWDNCADCTEQQFHQQQQRHHQQQQLDVSHVATSIPYTSFAGGPIGLNVVDSSYTMVESMPFGHPHSQQPNSHGNMMPTGHTHWSSGPAPSVFAAPMVSEPGFDAYGVWAHDPYVPTTAGQ